MGSKKQWDELRKYNPYKGRIPPAPTYDDWENEDKHDHYCGKFDVSENSMIPDIDTVDDMCPLVS